MHKCLVDVFMVVYGLVDIKKIVVCIFSISFIIHKEPMRRLRLNSKIYALKIKKSI